MSQIDLLGELERNGDLATLIAAPPIAIHRVFADLTGSALAGLLLTCLLQEYELREGVLADETIVLSARQLHARGGLSKSEVALACRTLRAQALVTQHRQASGGLCFRIDFERLTRRILEMASNAPAAIEAGRAH